VQPHINHSQNMSTTSFYELPTEEQAKACYREFRDQTSNAALQSVVCGVCGWLSDMLDKSRGSCELPLDLLPNRQKLVPQR
jgi:hypothetical protein